jgi:threonine/homoserine/homoserine lactone efflux protein
MEAFIKGLSFGFCLAAVVGPISLICIQRMLSSGPLSGFFSGLGATAVDGIYGFIAIYGFTTAITFLEQYRAPLSLFGGSFLCAIGLKIIFSNPQLQQLGNNKQSSLLKDFISVFFLNAINPLTIFAFMGLATGICIQEAASKWSIVTMFVTGNLIGATSWWLLLSIIIHLIREKLNTTTLIWINRIAGSMVIAFGLYNFRCLFM